MTRCLIGHTGFVGGSLLRQTAFDACFNSKSIQEIRGRAFDEIVCAGTPGVKWKANKEPEADRASIQLLIDCLSRATASSFVFISTIDVYPVARDVDEDTPIDLDQTSPYGRHRLLVEDFARGRFATTVLRLPGLFGPGLRKNVIFDLLNDNCLDAIDPASIFQFYNVERTWEDAQIAKRYGIELVNVATEPVSVDELARHCFDRALPATGQPPRARYDMHSKHGRSWGHDGRYLYGKEQVLREMRSFVQGELMRMRERTP